MIESLSFGLTISCSLGAGTTFARDLGSPGAASIHESLSCSIKLDAEKYDLSCRRDVSSNMDQRDALSPVEFKSESTAVQRVYRPKRETRINAPTKHGRLHSSPFRVRSVRWAPFFDTF